MRALLVVLLQSKVSKMIGQQKFHYTCLISRFSLCTGSEPQNSDMIKDETVIDFY